MRCSRCGVCCLETEMLLSSGDIARLERDGHTTERFAQLGSDGYFTLRNNQGCCVFYDKEKRRCKVYLSRPSGCRIYPIIHDEERGVLIDRICPVKSMITLQEKEKKGRAVVKLLAKIDLEARSRRLSKES